MGKKRRRQPPAPTLEPQRVVDEGGLRAEVYSVDFRAGFWTRLAMLRARLWGRLGVDSRAAAATREVIPAMSASPWLAVWVGQMLARHGDREEACRVFCEQQHLPEGHPEAYATLGRYLLSVGRAERAASFLDEATRLCPGDGAIRADYERAISLAGAHGRGA